MKAQAPKTKALAKTIDSTLENLTTRFHRLPRLLRGARRSMRTFGSSAARYAKERPARVIAGVLLVSLAVRKLARRA